MKKSKRIDKKTRDLIDSISDLIRRKNKDNEYRFKGVKKKQLKSIKQTCPHWIARKGRYDPAVYTIDNDFFACRICGKKFPINPLTKDEYETASEAFLAMVNQVFLYSVQLGGDSADSETLIKLKRLVPRFAKIANNVAKALDKRKEEEKRKSQAQSNSQFSNYSSYSYRP